jgi:DNA-binding CsgD family transcriptional regulator
MYLNRAGRRRAAREALQEGLDLAARSGAEPVVDRALAQLRVLGSKPRRLMFSGLESLTASQRRTAELALTGATNREIAQTLFVTVKTVENHLSSVYRKLDISRRDELPRALGMTVDAEPDALTASRS